MTTYIALLRAINIGPHNKVGMSDLRDLLSALGMQDVQTLLQSGNTIFRSDVRTGAQLDSLIEGAISTRLHLQTDVMVRSHREWKAIIAANPFPKEARRDPSEVVRVDGRCAYIVYPHGIGRSKLTSAPIEKKLGTRGTGRNWNTVLKLDALADSMR